MGVAAPPRQWPPEFLGRMRALLGEDFGAFLEALARPRSRGLRLNPEKVGVEELRSLLRLELKQVPWCSSGFSFEDGPRLGTHPAHLAGLFYLQDPSAMSAVEVMDPEPDWKVVDLAAAPGGKTTHLLSRIGTDGLVVANEVVGRRLRPLHENIDRWGAARAVTASADLDRLAEQLPGFFDAALLDAPCSGEALLRRDPAVASQWSPAVVTGSARRQQQLLEHANRLVRPGGVLVYSTCTFEVEENEERIAALLEGDPEWELLEVERREGFEPGVGLPPWPTERTARLWPHQVAGDGQFVALLRRGDGGSAPRLDDVPSSRPAGRRRMHGRSRPERRHSSADRQAVRQWESFASETVPGLQLPEGRLIERGPYLYQLPAAAEEIPTGLLVRPGIPLGMARPGRFQPSQSLACLLEPRLVSDHVSWSARDERLTAYLRGETVESDGPDGWVLVCYERWGVGWGRRAGGILKNFLPHHLRTQARPRPAVDDDDAG